MFLTWQFLGEAEIEESDEEEQCAVDDEPEPPGPHPHRIVWGDAKAAWGGVGRGEGRGKQTAR